MINQILIVGEVKRIQVSEPKDPKKDPSAVLLVQYGNPREATGGPVEFVPAVMVRVPAYRFPRIRDKLKVGVQVLIQGHLQGVYKQQAVMPDGGFFTTELVADRVTIHDQPILIPSNRGESADAAE